MPIVRMKWVFPEHNGPYQTLARRDGMAESECGTGDDGNAPSEVSCHCPESPLNPPSSRAFSEFTFQVAIRTALDYCR